MKYLIPIIVFLCSPAFAFQPGYIKNDGTFVPPKYDNGFRPGYIDNTDGWIPPETADDNDDLLTPALRNELLQRVFDRHKTDDEQ